MRGRRLPRSQGPEGGDAEPREPDDPRLTVVLLIGEQRARAARSLQSVLDQEAIDQMEVLVLDCAPEGTPPLEHSDHPRVRTLYLAPKTPFGSARAEAVRQARASNIAFLEEHAVAMPGWAGAVIRALEGPWAGVGGEIHNANPGVGISDAVAMMNYAPWLPPAPRVESQLVAGHNAAYKRRPLVEYGDQLDLLLRNEPLLQWRLYGDGQKMFVEPDAQIAHTNETSLGSICRGYYLWNRCFGPTRAEVFHWPRWKRLVRLAIIPLVPWVRLARIMGEVVRKRPSLALSFLRWLPTMVVAQYSAVLGESAGLLFGIGNADPQFLDYELNEPRETEDTLPG